MANQYVRVNLCVHSRCIRDLEDMFFVTHTQKKATDLKLNSQYGTVTIKRCKHNSSYGDDYSWGYAFHLCAFHITANALGTQVNHLASRT